jgi:hypothetical protein
MWVAARAKGILADGASLDTVARNDSLFHHYVVGNRFVNVTPPNSLDSGARADQVLGISAGGTYPVSDEFPNSPNLGIETTENWFERTIVWAGCNTFVDVPTRYEARASRTIKNFIGPVAPQDTPVVETNDLSAEDCRAGVP